MTARPHRFDYTIHPADPVDSEPFARFVAANPVGGSRCEVPLNPDVTVLAWSGDQVIGYATLYSVSPVTSESLSRLITESVAFAAHPDPALSRVVTRHLLGRLRPRELITADVTRTAESTTEIVAIVETDHVSPHGARRRAVWGPAPSLVIAND